MPNRRTKPQILTCGDVGVCRWPRRAAAGGVQASDIPEGEPAQTGSQSQGPPAQTGGSEETSDCCSGQREPEGKSAWSDAGNFGVSDSASPFERLFPLWQADYLQEASVLMAKLCYVEGEYRDALGNPRSLWSVVIFVHYLAFLSDLRAKGAGGIRGWCKRFVPRWQKAIYRSVCRTFSTCDVCWWVY